MPKVSCVEGVADAMEQAIRWDKGIIDGSVSPAAQPTSKQSYRRGIEMDRGYPSQESQYQCVRNVWEIEDE